MMLDWNAYLEQVSACVKEVSERGCRLRRAREQCQQDHPSGRQDP